MKRLDNVHVKQEGATGGPGFDFLEFRILWIAQGQSSPASVLMEALHPHSACHPLKPNVRKDRKSLAFRLDRLVPSECECRRRRRSMICLSNVLAVKSQQAKGVGSRAYGDHGRSLLTILQDSIGWIKQLQQQKTERREQSSQPHELSLHHQSSILAPTLLFCDSFSPPVLISSVSSAFVSVRGSRCSIWYDALGPQHFSHCVCIQRGEQGSCWALRPASVSARLPLTGGPCSLARQEHLLCVRGVRRGWEVK